MPHIVKSDPTYFARPSNLKEIGERARDLGHLGEVYPPLDPSAFFSDFLGLILGLEKRLNPTQMSFGDSSRRYWHGGHIPLFGPLTGIRKATDCLLLAFNITKLSEGRADGIGWSTVNGVWKPPLPEVEPAVWKTLRMYGEKILTHLANDLSDDIHALDGTVGNNETENHGHKPQAEALHSDDFRTVNWYGTEYIFTFTQAECVRVLWEEWARGTPEVSEVTIQSKMGRRCGRLRDVFKKSNNGTHPAWGTMICRGTKGAFRLKKPEIS